MLANTESFTVVAGQTLIADPKQLKACKEQIC